jgi:hypothetical protein
MHNRMHVPDAIQSEHHDDQAVDGGGGREAASIKAR